MTYSRTFPVGSALTVYVKPVDADALPSSVPAWATGKVSPSSSAGGFALFVGLTSGQRYVVYEQAGANPASTDEPIGELTDSLLNDFKADPHLGTADGGLVANVGKIPRAATAKADGEAVTRSKIGTATASTLTETLS